MSDRRETTESNAGKFLGTEMLAPGPMRTLSDDMAPAKPEPEDEWRIPTGPLDRIESQDEAIPEPAHSGRAVGLLHRLTHKG